MTTSKRVAERKVAKFEKNITKRGMPSKGAYDPTHVVIIIFAFLVIASFIFQVVRLALNGGVY